MFNRKRKKRASTDIKIRVVITEPVLESIFDECDKHDINETGGRIIGFYRVHNNELQIDVRNVIDSGPKARRTPASFFQDGEYQESVFRQIESKHPSIEHLGNWHTHHVNGLDTLSRGDITTYTRVVNHKNHNTDFFYALLVVAKSSRNDSLDRYTIKHFLLRRGDRNVYEIPASQVKIVKKRPLRIEPAREYEDSHTSISDSHASKIAHVRAKDRQFIAEMYPDLKPFISKKAESLYWRGKLDLPDDSSVEILVMESIENSRTSYSIKLIGEAYNRFETSKAFIKRSFESARKAIWLFERDLNRELFRKSNPQ